MATDNREINLRINRRGAWEQEKAFLFPSLIGNRVTKNTKGAFAHCKGAGRNKSYLRLLNNNLS